VKASMAIPIHFGMYEGTQADAEKFRDLLEGEIDVRFLPQADE
jgi:L-ascorbate metabolism protein UlaG (beta-lactamase superfamily)